MNEQLKSQVLEQLKSANNVLVAVSSNPTVDELSASIALTLLLNKMNKHATTVFSGVVPSTLEFLQPEKTIETTTDSLRDFIIALDKSKADKLRYKVEDDVVRIFITPYRTSISDQDLQFSQGDFNVDVVLALGVTKREDLDRAITAHGRILHDATVVSLTKRDIASELGSMNWQEPQASSLCEMVSVLSIELDRQAIDGQMATALMTGIIAETDRFRNNMTTPLALSLSSQLMSAGANQQLIAEKLEEPEPQPIPEAPMPANDSMPAQPVDTPVQPAEEPAKPNDGELEITHEEDDIEKIHIDGEGNLSPHDDDVLPVVAPENQQKPVYSEEKLAPELDAVADLFPQEESTEKSSDSEPESNAEEESAAKQEENEQPETVTESQDDNDAPSVPAIEHTIPTMTHGKTILPPSHEGDNQKSDKPFDLQEALKNEIAKEEQVEGTLPQVQSKSSDTSDAPHVEAPQDIQTTVAPPVPLIPTTTVAPSPKTPAPDESLLALEHTVESPHVQSQQDLDSVRDSVAKAADAIVSPFPSPSQSLGAQSVDMQTQPSVAPAQPAVNTPQVVDPNAAPPVPPPMPLTPQFYDENGNNHTPLNS